MADKPMPEIERVQIALGYIQPDDRDTWRKVGMALKAEFGEDGYSIWIEWSRDAKSFSARDARDVWKSFKGGRITINTLFHLAKTGGFDPKAHRAAPMVAGERQRRESEREQRELRERELEDKRHAAAAVDAERIWAEAPAASSDHPYLKRKGVKADALRVYNGPLRIGTAACDGALVVPARDAAGKLWTLEFILEDGQKRFLTNGRKSGCFALLGGAVRDTLLIGEGFATCATLVSSTGFPAAVAFDASNLLAVATGLREQHPDARIVLCADDDYKTNGNPGVTKAQAAAEAVGGVVAIPDFGDDRPSAGTDFNDLAVHCGPDAVAAAVYAALAVRGAQAASKGSQPIATQKAAKRPKTARAQDGKSRFIVDDKGVWFHGFSSQGEPLPPHWVSTRIDVVAETRNEANSEWGYLLEFTDRDGIQKRWAVPAGLFAGDGTELRRTLLEMGVKRGDADRAHADRELYPDGTDRRARALRAPRRLAWRGVRVAGSRYRQGP